MQGNKSIFLKSSVGEKLHISQAGCEIGEVELKTVSLMDAFLLVLSSYSNITNRTADRKKIYIKVPSHVDPLRPHGPMWVTWPMWPLLI